MSPRPVTPADGVAWVTGASSGIGLATAGRLAKAGWTVFATARNEAALRELADGSGGRIIALPGDVTDAEAMAEAVRTIEAAGRPLALALLNAGVFLPTRVESLELADFTKTFRVNMDGTANALVPAIEAMKARRRGQIAIVSSVAGYGGLPTASAYGASKAGLTNLAEALKFDLDKLGILIQVIHPGFVDTPATDDNPFPMPFIVSVDTAADRITRGLAKGRFEIVFPRRFAFILKALQLLPYGLYFPLVARATGWR